MPVPTRQRQTYLDVLRILASFLICYNHAFGYHLFLEQEPDGSLMCWFNIFQSALTSINLPLFFMISGALLLGKTESYRTVLCKRVWRILVLIVAAFFVTHFIVVPGKSLKDSLYQFLNGTNTGVYWFLFAYLGFLLLLPMLRHLAQHMTHPDMIALVALRTILVPGLMTLNFWLDHWGFQPLFLLGQFNVPLATIDSFFYPIVGYYLAQKIPMEQLNSRHIRLCAAVLLAGTILASVMTYAEGYYRTYTQDYVRMFGYTSAMAVFVIVRYAMARITLPRKLESFLSGVSSVTIGIYFLEPVVGHWLYSAFFHNVPWETLIITAYSCMWCIVCMTTGGTITWLLRKIPGVKKYL